MQEFLGAYYLWIKAVHVIAVISWMAAMLYLPRLFVYHASAVPGSELSETLKIMERRLLKFICNPAMIAAWIFGLLMLYANPEILQGQGWMHAKLLFVVLLSGVHGVLAKNTRLFAQDKNAKSAKYFRILNEIPTVLMIGIVVFVIARPF
ncbi:MAG: protoporphyrinogen oxidase HemJ [Alphaproteobacteria bacterium]|nr:protoporphyrinogen oxidase HemJ [Alphaproteobacteria bacterium]MCD8569945.1 protoporphyrinogen oxidase HemJ [Alphaproteobacteria bacterium]